MMRAWFALLLLLVSVWMRCGCDARAPEPLVLPNLNDSIEHQVHEQEALFLAKELFRLKAPAKSGCGACSSQDMDYCWGTDLLHDHCCCDHDLPEKFPYIPHVCYNKQVPLCKTVAEDCEEYSRLDACCCQPYLRPQWQYYSWTKSIGINCKPSFSIFAIFMIATIFQLF